MTLNSLPAGMFDCIQDASATPSFRHRATGLEFRHVPAGEFVMGLSSPELTAATALSQQLQANVDEMRPLRSRRTSAMLVATTPVLNRHMEATHDGDERDRPAWFPRGEAEAFATRHGLRLPKEHEWEHCCRAGTPTLFPFGDTLPDDEVLARWLSSDFSPDRRPFANALGLCGLFEPQWCDDAFKIDLRDDAPLLDGSHAVRGGGAYFWPWQDNEWVWCMSAMRSPASALEDGRACLRLVLDA